MEESPQIEEKLESCQSVSSLTTKFAAHSKEDQEKDDKKFIFGEKMNVFNKPQ